MSIPPCSRVRTSTAIASWTWTPPFRWLIRNDIGWGIGQSGAELYTGLDYGHVGGPSTKYLLGNHLAGAVIGVRGAWKNLNYDLFVGAPVWKPEGYRTARVTAGFNLNVSF